MRFAVSAFGLALLVSQLGVPACAQAPGQAPSPVYAWPVSQSGDAGQRSWGGQGYQGYPANQGSAAQSPFQVAGFPFGRFGNGWGGRGSGGYQYCPPGATPTYPAYPPMQAPQMAPPIAPAMPGQPMPIAPGQPMDAAPGLAPPMQQPQPGAPPIQPVPQDPAAPQDQGLAPPVTQPDTSAPTDAQLDQFAAADSPSSNFESQFASGGEAVAPNLVGDNFGITASSPLRFTVRATNASGTILSGSPGNLFSTLGFDADPPSGIDVLSNGPGQIRFGQVVFPLAEPVSPNILEGPDDACFRYIGGTAVGDDPTGFTDPWDLTLIYECNQAVITTAGSNVGRIKTTEDVSPIPRDRFFFNYSLFTGVPLTQDGISVNRFTPGIEEAFCDDLVSLEVRLPMAVTLNSTYDLSDLDISEWEFGDVYVAFKHLFYRCDNRYLSAGLSVSIPTAKDSQVFLNNELLARINNRSFRVAPFIGGLIHNDIFFAQGFIQCDVDVSGDDVRNDSDMDGNLEHAGILQDPTLLYCDLQLGAWLLRDTRGLRQRGWITGLASIFEMHYNRSLNDLDSVDVPVRLGTDVNGFFTLGNPNNNIDVLNLLAGGVLDFRGRSNVSVTYGVPVTNDKQFDGELRVMFNRFL